MQTIWELMQSGWMVGVLAVIGLLALVGVAGFVGLILYLCRNKPPVDEF
jgi:hypothetical protein